MTIAEAIDVLNALQNRWGGQTKLYFDCPSCNKSYTPDYATAELIALVKGVKENK